jgi:hypothetical protein
MHFTSQQNNFTQITSVHSTSRHFTYSHSVPARIPFACNYIRNSLSTSVILQGKEASKPAGNLFQLLMVLFTKECSALLEVAFKITCEMRKLLWSENIRLALFTPTVNCCVPLLWY